MKKSVKLLSVCGFVLALISSTCLSQTTFTFDEYGNGGLPVTLGPDPSGGVTTAPVLIYTLPFAVTPGDVVLTETNNPGAPADSDVVRFWNPTSNPNQTEIIFYSDFGANDPADAPADVGTPGQLITPVFISELGPEGNNGAVYLPAAGAPGSAFSGVAVQYNVLSDSPVPEPGSVALWLTGVGMLGAINRFRRKSLDGRLPS